MTYISAEARQELLDTVADAAEDVAVALEALGGAYEHLDERSADVLEEQLFRPLQTAFARARRTYTGFAERYGLSTRQLEPAATSLPSTGVRAFLEAAVAAVTEADGELAELQDSMMPVEVGDAELRAGLGDLRSALADVPPRAQVFMRTWGR